MVRPIVAALFALAVFYAGWPAFSAYQIHRALESGDARTLTDKIDFDRVKSTLRPAVSAEVKRIVSKAVGQTDGEAGALGPHLNAQLAPNVVDAALAEMATPDAFSRMYREDIAPRDYLRRVVSQKMSNLTELPGFGEISSANGSVMVADWGEADAPPPVPPAGRVGLPAKRTHGLGRIRECSLAGPLAVRCSATHDVAADKADFVIVFEFQGLDWKVSDISLPV